MKYIKEDKQIIFKGRTNYDIDITERTINGETNTVHVKKGIIIRQFATPNGEYFEIKGQDIGLHGIFTQHQFITASCTPVALTMKECRLY
jgi:hypothetical protein